MAFGTVSGDFLAVTVGPAAALVLGDVGAVKIVVQRVHAAPSPVLLFEIIVHTAGPC